jgi:hypothetical protein
LASTQHARRLIVDDDGTRRLKNNPPAEVLATAADQLPDCSPAQAELPAEYGGVINGERHKPRRTALELARAADDGRQVGAALRHLDSRR